MNKSQRELIEQGLGAYILDYVLENPPDYGKIANEKSTFIVTELKKIFLNQEISSDDFLLVDEIVSLLNKHGIETGGCHDF